MNVKNPEKWITTPCKWCGKLFTAYKVYEQIFCSSSCRAYSIASRTKNDPVYKEKQRIKTLENIKNGWHPTLVRHYSIGTCYNIKTRRKIKTKSIKQREHYRYRKWKKLVKEKFKNICQKCFTYYPIINAHHIKSWKDFPELRFNILNGIPLCDNCHKLVHHPQ